MTNCRVLDCGATTNAFLCGACLAELERTFAEAQSYRHEVSLLATKQTRVYRASGNTDSDLEQQRYEQAQAELWEAERRAKEARIAPAFRSKADRVALPSTPTMVNLGARDLLTEIDTAIVGWARVLHENAGADWPGFTTVGQVLVWLVANAEAIRWHEAAAEIHAEFSHLHRRMRRAVDRAPSRVYAGPCDAVTDDVKCTRPLYSSAPPHFDSEDDRARWWADHPIVCDGYRPPFDRSEGWAPGDEGCGAEHDRADRRGWMLAEVDDRLLPLSLLLDTLPELIRDELRAVPPRNVVNAWIRQKRLVPRTVIDGTEFYRGGDLRNLMVAYRPHAYAPRTKRGRLSA